MGVLDQFDDERPDASDEERTLPLMSLCSGAEALAPQPPPGWWALLRLQSHVTPVELTEVACWVVAVDNVQVWAPKRVSRPGSPTREAFAAEASYMVCHEPGGARVLVVHPVLRAQAEILLDKLQDVAWEDGQMGYGDAVLRPEIQVAAGRVFVRRLWHRMPLSAQVNALHECDLDAELLMQPDGAWVREVRCPYVLYEMAERTLPNYRDWR